MYCRSCGKKIPAGSAVCPECGARLSASSARRRQGVQILGISLSLSQLIICALAALSTVCFAISFLHFGNWTGFFIAAFLTFLCLKKQRYDTMIMAVPVTLLILKDIVYFFAVTTGNFHFLGSFYAFINIVHILIEAAVAVIYWLIVLGRIRGRRFRRIFALAAFALLGGIAFYTFLSAASFMSAVSSLAETFFFAAYFVTTLFTELSRSRR